MSDVNVTDTAPDQGQAAEVEQTEAQAPVNKEYFDPTEYTDHYVKVKVDGEEIEVPLSEALSGYSRTAHLTRKSQEMAEERQYVEFAKGLEERLANKDFAVLDQIAAFYGRDNTPQPAAPAAPAEPELTPEQRQIQEQQYTLDTLLLEKHLSEFGSKYSDFDPLEVVSAMADAGITRPDKEAMEYFYRRTVADKLYDAHVAAQAVAQAAEAKDAQVAQQKRQDGVVAGGGTAAAPTAQTPTQGRSIEDALALAIGDVNDGEWHW